MTNIQNVQGKTTTRLFIEAAERWPNRIRWKIPNGDDWQSVTWSEYAEKVYQVAAGIHSLGFVHPDKIGILAQNSIEWIYSALGIMVSNCILVPVYAGNTPDQSGYVIDHSDMKLLFAENPDQVNAIPKETLSNSMLQRIIIFSGAVEDCMVQQPIMSFSEFCNNGSNYLSQNTDLVETLAAKPKFDDIAYMIYTSGTTGNPKGVPLSHRNLATTTGDWIEINGPLVPKNVVDIHWLPNSHIFGWGAIGLGNIFGFESYLGTPLNVLELLPRLKPHVFLSVPAYFEKLYLLAINSSQNQDEQIRTLRSMTGGRLAFLLSGGAGLKIEVKEFFLSAGMWITEGYGLSECSPTLTMNRKNAYRFDSVGPPFPSVELKLAKDGEILARGDTVFSGYYKDAEATQAAFTQDGWFKTGDIGEWLDGGFLKIIDRKKDIIVTSGGKNIPPRNIETKFDDIPMIEHLLIYGDGKKYLVAFITLNELVLNAWAKQKNIPVNDWESLVTSQPVYDAINTIIINVNQQLASFETIKYFHISPDHFTPQNGLLTAALKIRRKEIYRKYKPLLESLYS